MNHSNDLESLSKRKALLDREIMAYHQAGVRCQRISRKHFPELESQEKNIRIGAVLLSGQRRFYGPVGSAKKSLAI
ncbi:MAG: hypothetical protein R3C24_17210 [Cyanobacteriota/Melainabacteria group bacterium]